MKTAVVSESAAGERRVALSPEVVAKLVAAGYEVSMQAGAGAGAFFEDAAYAQAGAEVVPEAMKTLADADLVLRVLPPTPAEADEVPDGATLISTGQPASYKDALDILAKHKASAFSLDLLPRISRAQSMDSLSSQASIAGYKAVLVAAGKLPKLFPMMMTAAGTIPPAKVLVMGAGVAGLQAIATAKRLGAQVFAYDVRPAVKEEVQSLGAKFVELDLEAAEGSGGYAAEQTEEFQRLQQDLIAGVVAASDVVITTAAIPGRPAPKLVTREMVKAMKPGSVIVDLAAATGGNCELTEDGGEKVENGVMVIGASSLPSTLATNASQVYAKNLMNLVLPATVEGSFTPDLDDEVFSATCVLKDGEYRMEI